MVKIYPLKQLSKTQFQRPRKAQMQAAQVWNACVEMHLTARLDHTPWPGRSALQKATKGRFALHSQSIQMVVHAFLATIDTTRQLHCQKYSRRWKKLHHARNKQCRRTERRVRDLRHKAARQVINFCVEEQVGTLFVGNPHGVRHQKNGRHHNQRMALWEYGKDIDYLAHKSKQAHMSSFTGSERGTSSRCPSCGHKHKPRKRNA